MKFGEALFGGGIGLCDGPMETIEYIWLNICSMLNWISSQNCINTLPLHKVDQRVMSAKNETLLWLAGIKNVKIQTRCKTYTVK